MKILKLLIGLLGIMVMVLGCKKDRDMPMEETEEETKELTVRVPLSFAFHNIVDPSSSVPRYCSAQDVFIIKKVPNAKSYKMTFYDISISHLAGFPGYPKGATWKADDPIPPLPDPNIPSQRNPRAWVVYDMGDSYYYFYHGRGANTSVGDPLGTCARYESEGQQVTGMAEVIITLK